MILLSFPVDALQFPSQPSVEYPTNNFFDGNVQSFLILHPVDPIGHLEDDSRLEEDNENPVQVISLENEKPQQEEQAEAARPSTFDVNNLNLGDLSSASNGTGGVYMINDYDGNTQVVFKPRDEENHSTFDNNGYLRERAAFVLDQGLSGVPETDIVSLDLGNGPQVGAIQSFVRNSEDAEDYGHGMFMTEDVHRIGVLDLRILNCDRHSGNMMRNKDTGKLIPIDHGSSFPDCFDHGLENISYEWLMYPQAKQKFSKELLAEIDEIDLEEDLRKLEEVGLTEGARLSTWMATMLLKKGAKAGHSLYNIGKLMQREGDRSKPSVLEKIFQEALDISMEEDSSDFFPMFSRLASQVIDQM